MKIHVFSDLHFDASSGGWIPELAEGADVVVCAGDVCQGLPEAFAFLRTFIPKPTPIITVAGNHSFYDRAMDEEWKVGRAAAVEHGITLLENEVTIIGGVRFIGATLWTDYRLYGDEHRVIAMDTARRGMNDHRLITWQKRPWQRFRPQEAARLFDGSASFIWSEMARPFDGPTVVVTHHAPSPQSVAEKYAGQTLNAAYASDLEDAILPDGPALWVHGHTHTSFDYQIGQTRILCNPHGYGRENVSGFDPACVVDLPLAGCTNDLLGAGRG